jgi:hypothetical protein
MTLATFKTRLTKIQDEIPQEQERALCTSFDKRFRAQKMLQNI